MSNEMNNTENTEATAEFDIAVSFEAARLRQDDINSETKSVEETLATRTKKNDRRNAEMDMWVTKANKKAKVFSVHAEDVATNNDVRIHVNIPGDSWNREVVDTISQTLSIQTLSYVAHPDFKLDFEEKFRGGSAWNHEDDSRGWFVTYRDNKYNDKALKNAKTLAANIDAHYDAINDKVARNARKETIIEMATAVLTDRYPNATKIEVERYRHQHYTTIRASVEFGPKKGFEAQVHADNDLTEVVFAGVKPYSYGQEQKNTLSLAVMDLVSTI